jgi:hypothetical protein
VNALVNNHVLLDCPTVQVSFITLIGYIFDTYSTQNVPNLSRTPRPQSRPDLELNLHLKWKRNTYSSKRYGDEELAP